ncbi:MAG TPA: D-2-hydroxyacid dehydrogenase [Holophagaceae bacterium]|nr:D-2-hydroxyacid dehydrogenase [Holophagaceae bacterium]
MKLAVIHHRHMDWVPALKEAEPRLDIRGWHPRELAGADWGWLAQAEGLFCWKLPDGLVARMPRLAWVQNSGAGVDHLVAHPELPSSIPITRADGAFGYWMARYVSGHLLAEAQRLTACADAQARAEWDPKLLPEDLTGSKAVVVGFGRIGRQIGRALRELGLEVHGGVREARPDPEFPLHGSAGWAALLPQARVLVLAAPLTAETRGLVDAKLLAHGHGGLTLVNVGRGELVVVEDLLAALDAGRLKRAVLDVFPQEPLPPESPLWRHPKVTVTPHHSGPSTPRQLIPDILPNLRAFAEGRPVEGAVDRAKGY